MRPEHRRAVASLLAGALLLLAPAYAARAPLAQISVDVSGETSLNFDAGTIQMKKFLLRQPPDTVIRSDQASGSNVVGGDYDNSNWVLTGNVHIEHQGSVLDANNARVVFKDRVLRSIEVRDKPARFSHPTNVAGQRYQGRADVIHFDGVNRRVRFTGNTRYAFGSNEGSSDKPMVYDLDAGVLSSDGNDPAARVRLTIRPGETPSIMVEGANTTLNFNQGTIQFDQFVLRQAPDTLIRAAKANGTGISAGNSENSNWALTGQVHVEYQQAVLDADSARVGFIARIIQAVEVRGAPARFSRPDKTPGRVFQGRADLIAFDNQKRQVRFNDHVWYSLSDGNEGTSDKPMIYDLESRTLSSDKDGNVPGGRIRMQISPTPKERVTIPRTPERSKAQ